MSDAELRTHVLRLLDWHDAHVTFDRAIEGIPSELRNKRPRKLPYSPWQLLEHLRRAQRDILDFCTNPGYEEQKWPDDYWPPPRRAPTEAAWRDSVAGFKADREALKQLASEVDLFNAIPHGSGQTYLREFLLVADHNAYHIGQLVLVRRLLGIWPEA